MYHSFEVKSECSNSKPMFSWKEPNTGESYISGGFQPVFTKMSVSHLSLRISVNFPVMHIWSLTPGTCHS